MAGGRRGARASAWLSTTRTAGRSPTSTGRGLRRMVTASGTHAGLAEAIEAVGLVDHHVHGVTFPDLDGSRFESLITESDRAGAPGTSRWDSQVGFAIRRWCAPLLDLEPH